MTLDLEPASGLPLGLGADGRLVIGAALNSGCSVRRLSDMKDVLADPAAAGPAELYFMYRSCGCETDAELLGRAGLRYDITVLIPGLIGSEFVKTAGHYHPEAGAGVGYPEVYEVIFGTAHYLLQKPGPDGELEDAVLIEARSGDRVLVPPGYGHVTVNPGPGPLVMCNLVAGCFDSVYEPYRCRRGAAYYETEDGGRPVFRPNPGYGVCPDLRLEAPGLWIAQSGRPLYADALNNLGAFACLTRPQDYFFGVGNPSLKAQ